MSDDKTDLSKTNPLAKLEKKAKVKRAVEVPTVVNPMGLEELGKLKGELGKTGLEGLFAFPESEGKTFSDVLNGVLGLQNKDMYSILERTRMTDEQNAIFTDNIHTAAHGIGIDGLDIPIPQVGERVVHMLRGKMSLDGASRGEFERITSAWIRTLYAQAEQKQKEADRKWQGS